MKGKSGMLKAMLVVMVVVFATGCATITRQFESQCKERGVEFNIWKEVRAGLAGSGFDPADFDIQVKKCQGMSSGSRCSCDVSVSGYVCDQKDFDEVVRIVQNVKGMEVGTADDDGLEVIEPTELKFVQSNQFIFFLNRNKELYPGDSLNAGYVKTPVGTFEALIKREQKQMLPALQFEGVELNLMAAEQPKKLCYKYFAPVPFSKLSEFPGTCNIVMEDFQYGDNVYLMCGGKWYLAGTWKDKPEKQEQLPAHLSGYSLQQSD
ncbi:MAG TPA: hypothetical protein VJL89_01630 [Thermodesulfovibrionia bacterium]|nr:hypothetical protein [Thermodesulfovibrionia bacterium]